jgi:hypothetical protein
VGEFAGDTDGGPVPAMLELPTTTVLLSAWLLAAAPSHVPMAQPATVEQELPDDQALLPVAAVFFLRRLPPPSRLPGEAKGTGVP